MVALTEDQNSLFARPVLAWATTFRADGSPHSTVVWVDVVDGRVVFNTAIGRAKEKHLRADPRIAISALDPDNGYHYWSISGTATLSTEGADAQIDALAKKYLGVDTYPMRQPGEERITVTIEATQVVGQAAG